MSCGWHRFLGGGSGTGISLAGIRALIPVVSAAKKVVSSTAAYASKYYFVNIFKLKH